MSEQKQQCKACLEVIQQGAVVCPHCRTAQNYSSLEIVGRVLKWLAGGVTVERSRCAAGKA